MKCKQFLINLFTACAIFLTKAQTFESVKSLSQVKTVLLIRRILNNNILLDQKDL